MKRRIGLPIVIVIALVAFGAGAGAGIAGWLWFWSGDGQPSMAAGERVQTLSLDAPAATVAATAVQNVAAPQLSLGEATAESTPEGSSMVGQLSKPLPSGYQREQITPEATPEITPEATPEVVATEVPSSPITITRGLYRINPEASQVTFTLQEDLRGARVDVIGITQDVAGDLIVDFTNPGASQVGQVVISARTLETDNSFRNQAIRSEILKSAQDAYEFITFTPTAITGLEDATVTTGAPLTFQLTGDLTIVDTTLPITFDVTTTVIDEGELTGEASTVVKWADFGLGIPSVPGVANITEDTTLAIRFSADLVDSEGGSASTTVDFSRALFRINDQSLVSFTLQEDLRGTRIDVIGTTNEVGGDIIVDVSDPTASQVGQLIISARTLETDNTFRNQAIRSEILKSAQDAYEFITFTPTALTGLEEVTVAVGESLTFQVTGDLTIVDTTLPVTFDVTATLTSADQLTGEASVTVQWADFGLSIPSVPGVANITEDVTLAISFVADVVEKQ